MVAASTDYLDMPCVAAERLWMSVRYEMDEFGCDDYHAVDEDDELLEQQGRILDDDWNTAGAANKDGRG